jgi:hypothetical protein
MHTHLNATITSGAKTHNHLNHNSGYKICGFPASTQHRHMCSVDTKGSHTHDIQISFNGADLGSPDWWNHTHTITIVTESNSTVGNHTHIESHDQGECDACAGLPHTPPDTTSGATVDTHSDHTIIFSTGVAEHVLGTPDNHTHPILDNTGNGGNHTHSTAGIAAQVCAKAISHTHTLSQWISGAHLHSVTGNSGSGGEAAVTVRGYSKAYILLLPIAVILKVRENVQKKEKRKKAYASTLSKIPQKARS